MYARTRKQRAESHYKTSPEKSSPGNPTINRPAPRLRIIPDKYRSRTSRPKIPREQHHALRLGHFPRIYDQFLRARSAPRSPACVYLSTRGRVASHLLSAPLGEASSSACTRDRINNAPESLFFGYAFYIWFSVPRARRRAALSYLYFARVLYTLGIASGRPRRVN